MTIQISLACTLADGEVDLTAGDVTHTQLIQIHDLGLTYLLVKNENGQYQRQVEASFFRRLVSVYNATFSTPLYNEEEGCYYAVRSMDEMRTLVESASNTFVRDKGMERSMHMKLLRDLQSMMKVASILEVDTFIIAG